MQKAKMNEGLKASGSIFVKDGIGNDILKGSAAAVGAMAVGLLGVWVISAMVSGIIAAGGPLELISSWYNAVTGGM